MRIGDLRHRVRIQERVLTPDGAGGFSESWEDVGEDPEVFAEISPLSAGERFRDRRVESAATHRITLRYRDDVTADMRLTRGEAVYAIRAAVNRDGRGVWLDIIAEVAV